jgi:MFS family permease
MTAAGPKAVGPRPPIAGRRRGLSALLVAETVSSAGTRMSQLALPWLVLTTTHSPVTAGLVGTAEIAPYVVLQVLGAPLVDRIGGRRVAVVGNLVAAAAMVAIPLVWARGLGVAPLLALVFVAGLFRGPADTATQVILPAVASAAGVPLDRAVALFDGAGRAASLLGAPIGGVLIAVIGAADVVVLDALSFLAAAVLLVILVPASAGDTRATDGSPAGLATGTDRAPDDEPPHTESYLGELRDGLEFLFRDRLLRSIGTMVLFTNFVDAAVSGLLLLLWAQARYGGTARLGVVVAVMGAGAVAGAALMAAQGGRLPRRWTYAVAFLVAGAPRLVVLALPAPYWSVLVVWGAAGLAAGAINPVLGAVQYDLIPRRLQARVLSAVNGIAWAGIPFGALLAGVLVTATDLTTSLVVGAVCYAVVTLDPFLRSVWSGMDRHEADPAEFVDPAERSDPSATTGVDGHCRARDGSGLPPAGKQCRDRSVEHVESLPPPRP